VANIRTIQTLQCLRGHFFCPILHKTVPISLFTFKRHEKLKSRKLTDRLFKDGKNFNNFPFRVIYIISGTGFSVPEGKAFLPGFPVQFGVGVGTRHFKKAVHRNRIKRLVREAWRLQKNNLYQTATERQLQLAVFFMFTDKVIPDYLRVFDKMKSSIQKLQQIIQAEKQ
jgi:ribonuclease P protein component